MAGLGLTTDALAPDPRRGPRAPPLRVGLTGGIGSGKSTVAGVLLQLGATLIDTDRIARDLTAAGGAAMPPIIEAFGANVVDASGALDRVRMRAHVFNDGVARRRLESILHPMIGAETARQAAASDRPIVVFDVPLLVESGRWAALVDRVWVVDCSVATQRARVLARPGWDGTTADAVIAQQATRAQRRAAADAVIDNDSVSLAALADDVGVLYRTSLALLS
ncbi:MAG TPA: dephospho-CoA kinase [Caldimonas sp.]|nr:dephospho-CoA kinase [Caldimonas sp.]